MLFKLFESALNMTLERELFREAEVSFIYKIWYIQGVTTQKLEKRCVR